MDCPVVEILDGKVQGTIRKDLDGKDYYAYFSIAYAKPPVGHLRFKAPQPAEPWKGIRDATKQRDICAQVPAGKPVGSEDCLTLHVFTKQLPSEEQNPKPVMVYIHGGGFLIGSNDIGKYGPEFLLKEDIVIVVINYRLGLLGFLSLDDPTLDVPGNAGLKDQVLALKWVQKNIKYFNGDPNNVTVCGQSAGATSTEYLVLSPSAKGLFHKAVLMSGSALCPWARGYFDPADFAKYLGHPNLSDKEILKLLTDMPAHELASKQMKFQEETVCCDFGFIAPVIEKPNPSAFITEHPIDLIQSGRYNAVPIITGYNNNEGLVEKCVRVLTGRNHQPHLMIKKYCPCDTNLKDHDHVNDVTKKLKEFYCRDEHKDNEDLLASDGLFVIGILTSAINQSKVSKNPVYLYRFSVDGEMNWVKKSAKLSDAGAAHGDINGYLWKTAVSKEENPVVHRLVKLLTNFAKYGNPTPPGNDLKVEWKPIQGEMVNYLDIGDELITGENPDVERLKFWQEIYQMSPVTAKFL